VQGAFLGKESLCGKNHCVPIFSLHFFHAKEMKQRNHPSHKETANRKISGDGKKYSLPPKRAHFAGKNGIFPIICTSFSLGLPLFAATAGHKPLR
jgi:hypothetical protein